MPFPLAHPAAVLPLRRYCPRHLSFPALVAGSLSPDAGYLFAKTGLADLSHSLAGGLPFGIIAGLGILAAFYGLGALLKKRPRAFHPTVLLLFEQPPGPAVSVTLSLCIGVLTHLFLDAFTHSHGWLATQMQILQKPLVPAFGGNVRVCHLLWYGFSFTGIVWLVITFRAWQDQRTLPVITGKSHLLEAVLVGLAILPIEVVHHLVHSRAAIAVVAAVSMTLGLVVFGRASPAKRAPR